MDRSTDSTSTLASASPAGGAAAAGDRRRGPTGPGRAAFVDRYLWACLALLGAVGFLTIWKFLPHERQIYAPWQFIVKICVFVLAIAAIATVPNRMRGCWLLASLPFVAFLSFIIPRMTHYFLLGPSYLPQYYTYLWELLYPGIMLAVCLAFRLGGGSTGIVIKIGLNGTILIFSGFLDIMFFLINQADYYTTPPIPHVYVILGHNPSWPGLIVFALCHVPVLVAVNLLPIDRWFARLRSPAAPAPAAPAPAAPAPAAPAR